MKKKHGHFAQMVKEVASIEHIIKQAERYEKLSNLNHSQFLEIHCRLLRSEGTLDELVDQLEKKS